MPKKELRPAPKALETAQKELRAIEDMQKIIDKMIQKRIVIEDEEIVNQLGKMMEVQNDLSRLIKEGDTRSDKANERELMKIHYGIRLQFNDRIRSKMDTFFELMDPAIAKTEEWKQMYQLYLKFSALDNLKIVEWNNEKFKVDERFSRLTEKVPVGELKVINRSILASRKKIVNLAEELEEAPESVEKLEELEREKQHLNDLVVCWPELNEIGNEAKELSKTKPNEAILNNVMDNAARLYTQIDVRQGRHTNSKEFDDMIMALYYVANWDSPDTLKMLMDANDTWRDIGNMLKVLKLTAQTYLDEKNSQHRPFPSAMRQSRLALAESLIEFVDESLERMSVRSKDAIDIEAYNVIINDPDKKAPKENRNDLNESIEFHPIENMSEMNDSSVSEREKLNISLMNVPDM